MNAQLLAFAKSHQVENPKVRGVWAVKDFWLLLPRVPAIYALCTRKLGLLYVGRATELCRRWTPQLYITEEGGICWESSHHRLRNALETPRCRLLWVQCSKQSLGAMERDAIKKLKPKWNIRMSDNPQPPPDPEETEEYKEWRRKGYAEISRSWNDWKKDKA